MAGKDTAVKKYAVGSADQPGYDAGPRAGSGLALRVTNLPSARENTPLLSAHRVSGGFFLSCTRVRLCFWFLFFFGITETPTTISHTFIIFGADSACLYADFLVAELGINS